MSLFCSNIFYSNPFCSNIFYSNPCFECWDTISTGIALNNAKYSIMTNLCYGNNNYYKLLTPELAWNQTINQYATSPGSQYFFNSTTPQGIYRPNGPSLDSTPETEGNTKEDRENYTKLKDIANLLLASDTLGYENDTLYSELKKAVEKKDGTYKEKSEAIKEVIEKIKNADGGNDILNTAIASNKDFKIISQSGKSETLNKRLIRIGLEKSDKVDSYISAFKIDLEDPDEEDASISYGPKEIAQFLSQNNQNNGQLLEFVSEWNSQEEKGIFDFLDDKYKDSELENNNIVNDVVEHIANALIEQAKRDFAGNKNIKDAIKNLEDSLEKCTETEIDTNLQKHFDVLYANVRLEEAKRLDADIKKYYNGIGIKIFEDNKYLNETIKDLNNEIEKSKLKIAKLNAIQPKAEEKPAGADEVVDADADEVVDADADEVADTDADEVADTDADEVADTDAGTVIATGTTTEDTETKTDAVATTAKKDGVEIKKTLKGSRRKQKKETFNTLIENVNEDNALDIFEGIFTGKKTQKRYFKKIRKRFGYETTDQINLAKMALEHAKKIGLEGTDSYKQLEKVLGYYDNDDTESTYSKDEKETLRNINMEDRRKEYYTNDHKNYGVPKRLKTRWGFFTRMRDEIVIEELIRNLVIIKCKEKEKEKEKKAQAQTINTIG